MEEHIHIFDEVHLTALAMRPNAGDVTALREAVLSVWPSSDALSWGFVAAEWAIPIVAGQMKPEDIVSQFLQAVFLKEQGRHSDALVVYDKILKLDSLYAEAWNSKGLALYELKRYTEARKAFEETERLGDPNARQALEILKQEGYYGSL